MSQQGNIDWAWPVKFASEKLHQAESYVSEKLLKSWSPSEIPNLAGKVALVTGGNSGLGYEAVKKLAENGAKVFMVSRVLKNGIHAAEEIRQQVGKDVKIEVLECDMSRLKNVEQLVHTVRRSTDRLDILINMAGVFHPGPYSKTEDGFEQTLGIDYFAPVLLTLGLLPLLRSTGNARVIIMASVAEMFGKYEPDNMTGDRFEDSGLRPYGAAKLYLIMFARELAGRVPDVDVLVVHPGLALTPLQHKASWRYITAVIITTQARIMGLPQHVAAYSTLYAATAPELSGKHFGYFGPSYMTNLGQTGERQPLNPAIKSPWSCWQVFENTVQILRTKANPELLKAVPRHPDDNPPHPPSSKAYNASSTPITA